MADIFVSYAQADRERVIPLVQALEAHGWTVWWDAEGVAGEVLQEMVNREIAAAKCMVVVWTYASVRSDWVLGEADEGRKRCILVPITVDDSEPPLQFRQFKTTSLAAWRGDPVHSDFRKAFEGVWRHAGAPSCGPGIASDAGWKVAPALPDMVCIEAGEFELGDLSGKGRENERPVHRVEIQNSFRLGKYPITFEEYDVFAHATGEGRPDDKCWGRGRQPVIYVTWDDAVAYSEWLSAQTGQRFRLPTEAEWEYAARAGMRTDYCFGDDATRLVEYAWFKGNAGGQPREVGLRKPNHWALHDMHGNVWEWTQDWWHASYDAAPEDGRSWEADDKGEGGMRVLRGGSWNNKAGNTLFAVRDAFHRANKTFNVGFRLAQDI